MMESRFYNASIQAIPLVDKQLCDKLFKQGDMHALSGYFLQNLEWFQQASPIVVGDDLRLEINRFIEIFLNYFTMPEFQIPDSQNLAYFSKNALISNLAAISKYKNTDDWLSILVQQDLPIVKTLTLYSTRNSVRIDITRLFDKHHFMASQWYATQGASLLFPIQRGHYENGRKLLSEFPVKYQVMTPETLFGLYFESTYIAPDYEQLHKSSLNNVITRDCPNLQQRGNPSPRKIAIITRRWQHGFSVHRSLLQYIQFLQGSYEVTLVHIGKMNERVDTRGFSDIRVFPNMSDVRNLTVDQRNAVEDQDWSFIYYPDVGMDCESIYLANQRLAPLQAAGYGHPASTHSNMIDYFIAGEAVETASPSLGYFSERLVLLPGIGMYPVWPVVDVPDQVVSLKSDCISINCSWSGFKIHPDIISDMKKIILGCTKTVVFRVFGGTDGIKHAGFPVHVYELRDALGSKHVEFIPMSSLDEYYREMANCQITLMSYPFSGYNTVIDSLYLSIPVVTKCGDHGYSNFPAQLLREIDIEELIANSRDDFVDKIIRLVNDDQYRVQLSEKIKACDIQECISKRFDADVFRRAVDYLLANHNSLINEESREPIHIT